MKDKTGWLSTHVLDTANGCPAAGIELSLWRLDAEKSGVDSQNRSNYQHLKTFTTNSDGRTDTPLLEGEDFQSGLYEIVFVVGKYFIAKAPDLHKTHPFLDLVPVRFGVEDASVHYHVPLLVSPWSYSTYRGS